MANMANLAALIREVLPDLNWAGFYRRIGDELVRGPSREEAACVRIPLARGSAERRRRTGATQVVRTCTPSPVTSPAMPASPVRTGRAGDPRRSGRGGDRPRQPDPGPLRRGRRPRYRGSGEADRGADLMEEWSWIPRRPNRFSRLVHSRGECSRIILVDAAARFGHCWVTRFDALVRLPRGCADRAARETRSKRNACRKN